MEKDLVTSWKSVGGTEEEGREKGSGGEHGFVLQGNCLLRESRNSPCVTSSSCSETEQRVSVKITLDKP